MSLKSKFVLLALLTAWMTTVADSASAEVVHENHLFPEFCPEDLDFNWFEPIYCDCGDERPTANLGFFFEYQRLSTSVSRAKQAIGGQDFSDWTNGNIFDFGYMRESTRHGTASGWLVSVQKIDNPERRLINTNIAQDGTVVDDIRGNPIGETFMTENAFNVYSIDINRVWRMKPTFNGAILEPFVGVRYNRIRDHFNILLYDRTDPVIPPTSTPNNELVFPLTDDFYDSETFTDNDLLGGQLGMRLSKRRGRWRLGTEIKGFAFHNMAETNIKQTHEHTDIQQSVLYGPNGRRLLIVDGEPITTIRIVDDTTNLNNRFTWGGELRLNAGFDITKKFTIEVGAQFMAFTNGIGRGPGFNKGTPLIHDKFPGQSFTTAGATLGFSVNR
ncbi:MAG: BBP7 family outer membrane beta-barrel protein [Planctomycetaceae bacterium]|nr:BBP7 family outer membrane beta-barrel protein [Planctomycetaceae bacterium]